MPRIFKRNCDFCGGYYEKYGSRFCSRKCGYAYLKKHEMGAFFDKKIQKENSKKGTETNRKNKTGACFNPEIRSQVRKRLQREKRAIYGMSKEERIKASKKGIDTCRRNGLGAFFNHEIHHKVCRLGGIKATKLNRKNNIGIFNKKAMKIARKKAIETNRRNRTGFFDPKVGSKGGLLAIKTIREKKPYWFHGVPFDSNKEREIAMNFYYNKIINLIEGKTCHVKVGLKEFDFFSEELKTFWEYHPILKSLYKINNSKDYYKERREVLDENGYRDYKLVILK